jgi:hypothetical protein
MVTKYRDVGLRGDVEVSSGWFGRLGQAVTMLASAHGQWRERACDILL